MTNHAHSHKHEPWNDLPEDFIERLEREARLGAPARDALLDRIVSMLDTPPTNIVDLGSGIGADSVALAARFPTARVHALDVSKQLLERMRSSVVAAGASARVSTHEIDLNGDWGSEVPQRIDLAWASLTLHHLEDPGRALRQMFGLLRPGGMIVLTELPSDEDRDWTAVLVEAGFELLEHQETGPDGPQGTAEGADGAHSVWIAVRPAPSAQPLGSFEAEVAVLGGGSAGLAAAIALARSRRSVVVIDGGEPRNAPAAGAHNVLGQEGVPPLELLARGRAEAEAYGVRIVPGRATAVTGSIDDFTVELGGGAHRVHAQRIILATGLVDGLPDIEGVSEGWGRSVLHCPFCHGWEVRDQRIAILTSGEVAIHQALLFSRLSDSVTVFLHDAPDPTDDQWEQLAALGVSVVRPRVRRLVMDGAQVRGVEIEGGRVFDADAAVVAPRFNARTELYESLGGVPETTPFGRQIPADPRGMTMVPGVWAAGNAANPMAMVTAAAASGVGAGAAVHGDLSMAELDRAVRERRDMTG